MLSSLCWNGASGKEKEGIFDEHISDPEVSVSTSKHSHTCTGVHTSMLVQAFLGPVPAWSI